MTALTMLWGLFDPTDLARISRIPADSITARTAPPAITPVPGDAGLRITFPAPFQMLAFLALSVIPSLKITDRGLVDVDRFELVPIAVDAGMPAQARS